MVAAAAVTAFVFWRLIVVGGTCTIIYLKHVALGNSFLVLFNSCWSHNSKEAGLHKNLLAIGSLILEDVNSMKYI